jgi:signal transduction histidine kinase
MRQALQEGRAADRRWHVRNGGSLFWADGILTPLYDSAGVHTGFAKVMRDATREKEAADSLKQAHAELEQRVQERTGELEQSNAALLAEAEERRRAVQARQTVMRQLATAEEDERSRISRDLHDQSGQLLAVLTLGLRQLQTQAETSPRVRDELERLHHVAEQVGRDIHNLAFQLRPTALDDWGLPRAMQHYLEDWSERTGISADFHVSGMDGERMSLEIETALYRIAQEALSNILKHANASTVSIILERSANQIRAIIEDNGLGFDPDAVPDDQEPRPHLGIVGMRERAALLGGELTIESTPGQGTSLYVRIPLENPS